MTRYRVSMAYPEIIYFRPTFDKRQEKIIEKALHGFLEL